MPAPDGTRAMAPRSRSLRRRFRCSRPAGICTGASTPAKNRASRSSLLLLGALYCRVRLLLSSSYCAFSPGLRPAPPTQGIGLLLSARSARKCPEITNAPAPDELRFPILPHQLVVLAVSATPILGGRSAPR